MQVRSGEELYPLKRFVLCGGCSNRVTASVSGGNGGKYSYYHCANKACKNHFRVPKEKLEDDFRTYLNGFQLSTVQEKLLTGRLAQEWQKRCDESEVKRQQALDKIEALRNEKRNVLRNLDKGMIMEGEAKGLIEDIRIQEVAYESSFSESTMDKHQANTVITHGMNLLENLGMLWANLDYPRQRFLQSVLFPKNVYYEDGLFRTNEISPFLVMIQTIKKEVDSAVTSDNFLVSPPGLEPGSEV